MLKIQESNKNFIVKNYYISVSQPAIAPVMDFLTPKLYRWIFQVFRKDYFQVQLCFLVREFMASYWID